MAKALGDETKDNLTVAAAPERIWVDASLTGAISRVFQQGDVEYIRADHFQPSAPVVMEASQAFDEWWATKEKEGYQYGREALSTVTFGFKAGFTAGLAASHIPTCDFSALVKIAAEKVYSLCEAGAGTSIPTLVEIERIITSTLAGKE